MTTKVTYGTTADGLTAATVGNNSYCIRTGAKGALFISMSMHFGNAPDISTMKEGDFFSHLGHVAGVDAFRAEMEDIAANVDEVKTLGRREVGSSTSTPWGKSQGATVYVEDGIYKHSTASHGGMKVYAKLNKLIPEPYRNKDGWYEEDGERNKVIVSLPQFFTKREVRQATEAVINRYPDEYEMVTGTKILPGQSLKRDEQLFHAKHANDWIGISASSFEDENGTKLVAVTASIGGERSRYENGREITVDTKVFIVPREEYSNGWQPFGFVIDESKHPEFVEKQPKDELREASEEELNHLFGKKP